MGVVSDILLAVILWPACFAVGFVVGRRLFRRRRVMVRLEMNPQPATEALRKMREILGDES